MKMGEKRFKTGFTLIELSFAIAFISVLLITITLITNEIVSIYRKGYSIKSVNQVGRDLIDDFQASITSSPPSDFVAFCNLAYPNKDNDNSYKKCAGENGNDGFYSVYQQFYKGGVHILGSDEGAKTVPIGGLFCSGKYTYIWNSGYILNTEGYYYTGEENARVPLTIADYGMTVNYTLSNGSSGSISNFRLLKVEDTSRSICGSTLSGDGKSYPKPSAMLVAPGSNTSSDRTINIKNVLAEAPEEMLQETDTSLAIYDLVVFPPARVKTTERLLFSGSFILGTTTGGVDIMTTSNFCKAPSTFSADFNYCAINKFNFTIQASGGAN